MARAISKSLWIVPVAFDPDPLFVRQQITALEWEASVEMFVVAWRVQLYQNECAAAGKTLKPEAMPVDYLQDLRLYHFRRDRFLETACKLRECGVHDNDVIILVWGGK